MSDQDLYSVLGVSRSADEAEIRKAYRKIARDNHPDRNPDDPAAEARFKRASYASEVLLNKKKRKLYDEFGEMGLREGFDPEMFRARRRGGPGGGGFGGFGGFPGAEQGVNLEDLFRTAGQGGGAAGNPFAGGGGGVNPDIMDALFGKAARARGAAGPVPRDLIADIDLGFLEALRGVEKEVGFTGPDGTKRTLRVRIPKGVKDGGKVRLRGQGTDGGDLVLAVHVGKHPYFSRDDNDLLLDLPVSVGEAIKGAKVTVPTPEGEVSLRVPGGIKSGTKLRLRGKGVERGAETGDLIVTVNVHVPKGEDPRLEELADELDTLYAAPVRADLHL